jgi:hypothetical protein
MDLQLDLNSHDLVLENYDLQLNTGLALVQQRLKQSLLFFLGEWFLDVTDGVPYYQDIFIKAPDIITVESIFKSTILETPDVLELISFELEYTNIDRGLSLEFEVKTTFGNLTISEVL